MTVDFREQLKRQLRFLESSAASYDSGNVEEAIRISVSLRVLFHHTNKSTSLLHHMRATNIHMLSTSSQHPVGLGLGLNVANNLVLNPFTGHMRASPWLDAAPTKTIVSFARWWKDEVVLFNAGIEVTRKTLVRWSANQDGGAHVDELPDADYLKVTRGLDFTWTVRNETEDTEMIVATQDLHLAALRQFAYEALHSPELLRLAPR